MTSRGDVRNSVIVLDPAAILGEGTEVRVETAESGEESTLADRLQQVIAIAEGLPPDLAEQHDLYLRGRGVK